MQVRLSPWQLEVANDTHRFKVICAGRRSGKSTLAILTVMKWALEKSGLYWIIAPTFDQGRDIFWTQGFKPMLNNAGWLQKCKFNETLLTITLPNGSLIAIKSAEKPDRLVGIKLRGLIVDEIAKMRNWETIWKQNLRPTLTDYEAPVMFISTPQGYNHFYELYQMGQQADSEYKSWRFTSYDNPYLPQGEIEKAKKELTEDTFAQEYMADFRKYTGLVYKEFQREVHVIEGFDVPDGWGVYRGIDFGSTNPTACIWVAVDGDDNWYVISEHYQTGETIDYHAGLINSNPFSNKVTASYGDPSGAQWIQEFAQRGIYITPANKETGTNFNSWVRFGIEKVSERLKITPGHTVQHVQAGDTSNGQSLGNPKLFVFNSCTNLIREFETYRWKEKSVTQAQDLNEPDVPEKANDHAMDALRYFAVSYKKQTNEYNDINKGLKEKWSI